MDDPYRIRSAVPADAAPLVTIERRCFSDPWSEASFREALESAWTFGLVAQNGRGIGIELLYDRLFGSLRQVAQDQIHFIANLLRRDVRVLIQK